MSSHWISPSGVEAAYRAACRLDVAALKPGNVSEGSPGHGMTADDFHASVQASAALMADPGLGLGERILQAVAATGNRVGCNTNLGILMLCAPLVQAVFRCRGPGGLRGALHEVLHTATREDTQRVFDAILLARPGGLGKSRRHDVREPARTRLLDAMAYAAERDLIARQYVTDFTDIFETALPYLITVRAAGREWCPAATGLFLFLLARYPDSHVRRQHGSAEALRVTRIAAEAHAAFLRDPEAVALDRLVSLDARFKADRINPGTTADLTVATLFLDRLLHEPVRDAGTEDRHFQRGLRTAMCGSPLISTL